jgi:hypothetical protein
MGVCDLLISKDIAPSCTDPIVPGFENEGIIINRDDIDFGACAFNATRKNVIETLVLKSGKRGYKILVMGAQPFNGTSTAFAAGTYRNTFTNTVAFAVLDDGPDVRNDVIDALANGEFVIILENKFKSLEKQQNKGDNSFQVYGWYQGLKASEMSDGKYSEDTDGGWAVTMQETKSPKSGLYLYKTGYSETAAMIETLLTEAD